MIHDKPSALSMSDRDKEATIRAVWTAVGIIHQRRKKLNAYRIEVLSNLDKVSGSFCFTFNMDFMKVSNKLLEGFLEPKFRRSQIREGQITIESFNIAKKTGVPYPAVKEMFLSMMKNYIIK